MERATRKQGWQDAAKRSPGGGRVLVVDDELPIRRTLQRLLRHFGYTVRTAGSAEEADSWLSAERFDVCLLDIDLPKMKGAEFLWWALVRDSNLAVLMLTGIDRPEIAIECMHGGAVRYLVKPVEAQLLMQAIRDAMAHRRRLSRQEEPIGPTSASATEESQT